MRTFDVQGIEIRASRSKLFEFVRDPGNLPRAAWPKHSTLSNE